ncbi:AraC family transcriptional regulator [Pedobacter frigiditerrae]|uniref:AraC family transcriptional regulator n=1 Tax=Pedobacter frigiditerrae TaxID=2530452 RepID=A0A4R0MPZ5_9SPHI|nr:AraC family transcriptional regulator [Pedobacter frigiditerrae]TCC88733.1 AraC family transcriptional regulator [Pedobacter frigiditerrae]
METSLMQNRTQLSTSLFTNYDEIKTSNEKLHSHPQYELVFTIGDEGTRFVGDNVSSFFCNDLVLVGPNLPHCWQSNNLSDPIFNTREVKVHFDQSFFGKEFYEMPEMKKVKNLLLLAQRGVVFSNETAAKMGNKIMQLSGKSNWLRVIELLSIICELAESDFNVLASETYTKSCKSGDDKLSNIYNYLMENHQRDINLKEIADFSNMNTTAFCRYFKKATSKTFSDILNIIRVGFACKKLLDTKLSISEIGYSCGYQNITYFNRQFKDIKKLTPTRYRLQYNNCA